MHLPPAVLASLRVCLGTTAMLGAAACDGAAEPAPTVAAPTLADVAAAFAADPAPPTVASSSAAGATTVTDEAALAQPTAPDHGDAIEAPRGRLRTRAPASTLAFTRIEGAVIPDRAATFEPCDPPPKAARPRPKATAAVGSKPRGWSCGPCGRG